MSNIGQYIIRFIVYNTNIGISLKIPISARNFTRETLSNMWPFSYEAASSHLAAATTLSKKKSFPLSEI